MQFTVKDSILNFKLKEKPMLRPLDNKILVKRHAQKEQTDSGIIIPDSARERVQTGTVLATGAGLRLPDGTVQAMELKEGDTIIFGKFDGYELHLNDDDLLIMDEDDIAGIVE